MSSKIYEESDYGLDLDLLIISYKIHVSFPRNGGVGECDHLWPIYLTIYILSPLSQQYIHFLISNIKHDVLNIEIVLLQFAILVLNVGSRQLVCCS